MEHYRKKRIRFYEAEALPNEIKVTNSSRTQEIASKAARRLKEAGSDGIVISSNGTAVSKAVTVVELLKRKIPNLIQETQIKYTRVEDIWEPDMEDLDVLKVVRRTPAIVITLKAASGSEEEETKVISEQTPLPADTRVDPSSSMMEEKPEISSTPSVGSATSEKTAKVTSATKRTKKSKSSRKST